ncbi:hypothetical protein [Bacillus solimangrovi]|uniref:Uncharacterized protein n=1 Tax=Bacillus solimangrovi TaxID=1305675 RepID=A0A1E5LGY2_9BACI|nr:hypothetical protein [Bacillus solimangrovi]OEH93333.1 hypothetical protein BFG57_12480 [Bacillus solimangrovi]
MWIVVLFAAITIFSVVFGLKLQKLYLLAMPFVALFVYMVIKIAMVPLPFWETVQLIFDLQ